MEKNRRYGPKSTMKGLPKASKARVMFLTLPKEVETEFDTGYGKNNNSKWEMDIKLLEHPNQEPGVMIWQTVAQVIRVEITSLMNVPGKDVRRDLEKDWTSMTWEILSDANGVINIQDV
jgi:hypothetical protein